MAKKVIAISTSPRKNSNSEILTDEFIRGAREAGHSCEKVRFSDCKIGYCHACEYCMTHDHVCIQKDDMAWILEKMLESDVIVLATPVYKSCMSAQLKTVADRMFAVNPIMRNKDFYFITSAGGDREDVESTMLSMEGITYAYKGSRVCGKVYGCDVMDPGEVRGNLTAMEEAYSYGKSL